MSGRHRRSDRRGLWVPAVATVLMALGLVLVAAGATTASRGGSASEPPPPLPAPAVPDDTTAGAPETNSTSKKRGEPSKGDKRTPDKKTPARSQKAPKAVPAPVRLEIPRLSIDESLVELGLTDTGQIAAPEDYAAPGWFSGGPRPGERGAAVIAGHVDDPDGPAIFYYLSALQTGDVVRVERADGSSVTFDVTRVTRHPQDEFPVDVFHADDHELRLITCGGEFTDGEYTHNVVVYADKR